MAGTYDPIATQTLASPASSVTFSSITSAYTDLMLIVSTANVDSSAQLYMRLNGSSASDYGVTYMVGYSGAYSSASQTPYSFTAVSRGSVSTEQLTCIVFFKNYSSTNVKKTIISRTSQANTDVWAGAGIWTSTAAISTILFSQTLGNLATGTTATLYGIKEA